MECVLTAMVIIFANVQPVGVDVRVQIKQHSVLKENVSMVDLAYPLY
jgi:hypothetical protein